MDQCFYLPLRNGKFPFGGLAESRFIKYFYFFEKCFKEKTKNFQQKKHGKVKNAKNTKNDEKTQDFLETFWRAKRARKNPYGTKQ